MKQPIFFIGHGSPMNAITENKFSLHLKDLKKYIETSPDAIMIISAHWLTKGTYVTGRDDQEIMYDFLNFPQELYKVSYPVKGNSKYSKIISELNSNIKPDMKYGIDHGAWALLVHMFPEANIPVFQLSLDYELSVENHYNLSKSLKAIRDENVLIIGSGNIVHNLRMWTFNPSPEPYDWAIDFDNKIKNKLVENDIYGLINYQKIGGISRLAVPNVDHFLPMIYTLGMKDDNETIEFTYEDVFSSISMRSFIFK